MNSIEHNDIVVDVDSVDANAVGLENCVGLIDEEISEVSDFVPKVGVKFSSADEAFEFYKKYAYTVGFPVKRRTPRKSDDGELRYVVFACCREGNRSMKSKKTLKPRPTIQMGCSARMAASLDAVGTWCISKVHLDHNHKTSPSKSRLYRCNHQLSEQVKRKLEVNDVAGIPLHKSFNSTVVEAGGYENLTYVEKDCRNYVDKVRRLRLGVGDAAAIQEYFSKMQSQCPGFFFCVDLDEESRLRNVFWADNRCKQAYKEFGDVVTFDTTYLTNRYDMPFAPFIGVNHHGQSTLLGCGLLSNEDTVTFVSLFKTWLQCMDDKAPVGIITDQDRAMQNAIAIVFPNTMHRWCLWYIMKKLLEKFGYHTDKGSILWSVHELVYESQTSKEFEHGWATMIDRYSLHSNDWLSGLYTERARWVPCYLKKNFWAGMSTTQRSESINAFFDGFVHSKTSLKQFVEQYELALRSRVEKEFQANFKSYSQMIPCATMFELEKQFQEVYTLAKFKEFQEELTGKMFCDITSAEEAFNGTIYEVQEDVMLNQLHRRKTFKVTFRRQECVIECSCHLFEFRGIVCRHSLSILIRNRVQMLPDSYVLRRWHRDVQRGYSRVKTNYAGLVSTVEQKRYDHLCHTFEKVANVVVDDEVSYKESVEWLENKLKDQTLKPHPVSNKQFTDTRAEMNNSLKTPILDSNTSKRKGALRKLRQKGPLETTKKGKGHSKARKGIDPTGKKIQESLPLTAESQDPQYPTLTPVSYSQQFMDAHYQQWNGPYGVNWVPTFGIDPTLISRNPPDEEDERDHYIL